MREIAITAALEPSAIASYEVPVDGRRGWADDLSDEAEAARAELARLRRQVVGGAWPVLAAICVNGDCRPLRDLVARLHGPNGGRSAGADRIRDQKALADFSGRARQALDALATVFRM